MDIPPGSTTIGRSRTCGVRLDDLAVSRNHAMLSRDGERVTVKDLESSNGTFLNGARLGIEVELTDGDVVAIGETEIVFRRVPAAAVVPPPDLSTRYVPRPTSSEAIAIGDVLPVGEVLAQSPAAWEKTNHGPAVRPRPVAVPTPPPMPPPAPPQAFAPPTRPQPVVVPAPPAAPPAQAATPPAPAASSPAPAEVVPFPAGPDRPATGELLPSIDDIERQLAAQEAAGPASGVLGRPGGARLPPAGFLRRFFALVIDGLLIVVIEMAVLFALGGPGDVTASLVAGLAGLACSVLLFTIGWWKFGATPGKKLLGLVVCDSSGAVGLPLGRAFVRWLGYLVSAIPLGAGYLVALFEPQKRALHDLMAGSYVGRRR
jgi:uncharacterized RDD family membrane protein YckC